jgi:hypothetical protein
MMCGGGEKRGEVDVQGGAGPGEFDSERFGWVTRDHPASEHRLTITSLWNV